MAREDLTGKTFGRLTVLGDSGERSGRSIKWRCQCSCGKIVNVRSYSLKSGNTKSCGCLKAERNSEAHKKHGMSRSKLYRVWGEMIQRCENPNDRKYHSYGARGIYVFAEWHDFEKFREYVINLEHFGEPGFSLDRINNDDGYAPGNVRWADLKLQGRNKRNNHFVKIRGEILTLSQVVEKYGINQGTLLSRVKAGCKGEDLIRPTNAIAKENDKKCKYFIEYKGKNLTVSEAAKIAGISSQSMRERYKNGKRGEDLFKESWYSKKKRGGADAICKKTLENNIEAGAEASPENVSIEMG